MIKLSNIKVTYENKAILDGISIDFESKGIVGIIGDNGCGKTSLLNVIANEVPYTGSVQTKASIGYLRQISSYRMQDFLYDDVYSRDFYRLLSEQGISESIIFDEEHLKNLSGGEKTKLILSKILSINHDVLLLDEPTNHLDESSKKWLINYLRRFKGLAIVVSHDREFINELVDYLIEIKDHKAVKYYGDYEFYLKEKETRDKSLKDDYKRHIKDQRKIEAEIIKYNNWSNKSEKQSSRSGGMLSDAKIFGAKTRQQMRAAKLSKQAKAKVSKLEQHLDKKVEKPFESKPIKFGLMDSDLRTNELIYIESIKKGFDDLLFTGKEITISAQDKIRVCGDNGTGKSTLIKIILKSEDFIGKIKFANHLKIAYLSQDIHDLPKSKTPLAISKNFDRTKQEMFTSNLINMNFDKVSLSKKISKMSLGERMKIKLALIIIEDYNMIIFDEPTNHLDIATKEVFERVITQYKGTMLIVSHDSYVVKSINKSLTIEDKELKISN